MARVLVTGGAGFIGSHAVHALRDQGHEMVVLDDLSNGSRQMLPKWAALTEGSIADEYLLRALLRLNNVEEIFHFAAYVDVAESEREPEKYYRNNTQGTKVLLKVAKEEGVKRFIFSSTAAVYGNPDIVPVPEDAPTRPVSHYGKSKLLAEELVKSSGLDYAILRYFNVAGVDPKCRTGYCLTKEPTHLIRKAVRVALGDFPELSIYGTDYPTPDGTAVRDYVHVSDLVRAHLDVLEYLRNGGKSDIFNIGYGQGHSVFEVVETISKKLNMRLPVLYADRRPGDPSMHVADSQKICNAVNWKPQFPSLGGMILDEVKWVQSQKARK